MSKLPKLSLPVHEITLPVTKEKIQMIPFVVKQEKSLLTTVDPKKPGEAIKLFKMLIEECVLTEDFDVSKMNIVDFYYLILKIRVKSTGEMIDGSRECKHCQKQTEFEINLEDSIVLKNEECTQMVVKISDELSIRIIPTNISSLFEEEKVDSIDLVAGSIDVVIIKEKIYKDFTKEELINNVMNIFTKMNYDHISKCMEKLVRLKIKFKYLCMNCGKENEFETDDITKV